MQLSASSRALDLALSQSPGPEAQVNGWNALAGHRLSQQALPQNASAPLTNGQLSNGLSTAEPQNSTEAMTNLRNPNRHSMEASLAAYAAQSSQASSTDSGRPTTLGSIHSSYSTNDVPTLKKANGLMTTNITPPKTQAQQQFHNHNASLGRIPPNAMNNRHSRELSGGDARRDEQANNYQQILSGLQASAAPFGPTTTVASPVESLSSPMAQYSGSVQFPNQAYFPGYGMQMMNMGMTPMHMANPLAFQNQIQAFQPQPGYSAYPNYSNQGRFQDSQARVMQQRRMQNGDDNARFSNVKLEQLQGEILGLCKDQHGCRFLQKKLEERNPEHIHIIFIETFQHVVELMTDPFGNYLCQKLLEFCNDDQRTILINNAAPEMVKIALNSHGTRALQKMIEFITTPEQIQTVILALSDKVVELIQDLNGNHVIQKCLNRLSATDAQVCRCFIEDTIDLKLTYHSLSSIPWEPIAWRLGPIVMAAVFYSAASIMQLGLRKPSSSAKSPPVHSILSKILLATTSCNTSLIFRKRNLPTPSTSRFRARFRPCQSRNLAPTWLKKSCARLMHMSRV